MSTRGGSQDATCHEGVEDDAGGPGVDGGCAVGLPADHLRAAHGVNHVSQCMRRTCGMWDIVAGFSHTTFSQSNQGAATEGAASRNGSAILHA